MSEDAAAGTPVSPHRPVKGRSPSYPGISLYTALERARTLYAREGKHPAPITAVTAHWGYKSTKTGPASVTYAALKKYGLIEDEGNGTNRVARLTPLALDIILDAPDARQAIQKAALLPPIHAEMWAEYGTDLPSDENLRWRLVAQRGFTESGFQDFIRVYRETIAWAQLSSTEGPTKPEEPEDDPEQPETPPPPAHEPPDPNHGRRGGMSGGTLTIPVPIIGGGAVMVEGQFPITSASWEQFMAVLAAMKPGLVSDEPKPPPAD